jgi:hypothetical protein
MPVVGSGKKAKNIWKSPKKIEFAFFPGKRRGGNWLYRPFLRLPEPDNSIEKIYADFPKFPYRIPPVCSMKSMK